jgi:lysophospholipase L1-like esterase
MTNCKLCCLALSIVFLLACLMPALAIEVSAQATVTKVMPLGDSITDGYNIPGGYRIDLWSTFQQAGQFVDFVGSMSNGPASLGDKHHEGHSGWRIEQINGSVSGWLSGAQPEIVLLMIGTNDMLQDYNVAGAPARLSALLDTITQQSPNTQVIVASLPPLSNAIANQRVLNFNAAIPDIVAAKAAGGKKVSFIDMYPRLTVGDLADGIHPNASGYTKLANAWYSALTPFLSAPASTPTPSRTPTRTNTATPSSTPMPGSAGFYRAINLGGPAVTHDGQAWDASSAPNYTVIGTSQCNPWLTYTPPVDTTKAAILGCWVQHWAHNLAVNNMPNGTYDVYLYVQQDWDDPNAQPFTLSVEGQSAAGWNPGGAGSWVRLGPIRRTVSDGAINVTSDGLANLAGVEIWTAGGNVPTPTNSPTPIPSPTHTHTPAPSATSTATPIASPTRTNTPAPSATSTPVDSTSTPTASNTTTPSHTVTPSNTVLPSPTPSHTPVPTTTGTSTFYRAINVNGPVVTIDANNWGASAGAANFTVNGTAMANQWLVPAPSTDSARGSMLKTWRQHWAFASTISAVPTGTYQVYIYVISDWNNPNPPTVTFKLEGAIVGTYVQGAAGSWSKLGPYTATITDGAIDVGAAGVVNVAGLEVWRVN